MYTCLEPNENGIGSDAIPESQENSATRQVNISDILGESDWWGRRSARRMFLHYRRRIQRRGIAHLCEVAKIPRVFGEVLP